MTSNKGCWGKLLLFAVVLVMTLVLAGEAKPVQAETCTEHVYDYSCDTRCNVCGEFRAMDHSFHHYGGNGTRHWWECDCGYISNGGQHWYDNDVDTTCNECGAVRELEHEFDAIGHDELYHWQECDCGVEEKKELHTYINGTCKLCGNQKPDWYDESTHRIKDGVEYISLKEAAAYSKIQLLNRKIGIGFDYYIDDDKIFQEGENLTALFNEMSRHTGVSTEGDLIWNLWNGGRNEEEFFDGTTHYYEVKNWTPYYGTTLEQEQKLSEEIDRIFKKLNIDTMTDYEKICVIYQYICDNVSYSHESLTYSSDADTQMVASAYGALINGYAVCDGYADLVYRMMLEAGIDTRVISSFSHAWNIVELEGVYYCVDATWDAGKNVEDYRNFLCGLAEFRDRGSDHSENIEFHTPEFFEQYPVSYVSYGMSLPETDQVVQSGSCGNLTWTLTGTGVFTIIGTGEMDFSTWWEWKGFIKKLVIGEGITSISDDAFSNCCALGEVIIPNTVTKIGNRAFRYCDSLESIALPESVTSLGHYVFWGCSGLKEVVLPNSVTSLGEGAFRGCFSLERVVFSKGICIMEKETFLDCIGLKTVVMPDGLEEIRENAFEGCVGLEEIVLPSTLKKIGEYVFKDAFSYKTKVSLTLPQSVTAVGYMCFGMSNLSEIIWNASAERIEAETFDECRYLERAVIGNSVKEIGKEAFGFCINLRNVALPEKLQKVEEKVFLCCIGLEEINIPGSVIGDKMFSGCENLRTVIISNKELSIGADAFYGCNNLKYAIFKGNVPQVTKPVFVDCKMSVFYPKNNGEWAGEKRNSLISGGNIIWIAMHSENEEHTKANQWSMDNFGHWYACTGCAKEYDRQDHVYDSEADMSCNICNYCKMVQGVHFRLGPNYDENSHWYECLCGEKFDVKEHSYANVNSAWCQECNYVRTISAHVHDEIVWFYDENSHWWNCSCGNSFQGGHEFATDQDDTCDTCGYVRTISAHVHDELVWSHDEQSHWWNCSCGDYTQGGHEYTSAQDATCDTCGYTRTVPQITEEPEKPQITEAPEEPTWSYDEISHWTQYSNGDYVSADHDYSTDRDDTCNVCGYVRVIPHEHNFLSKYDEESHYQECECGERNNVQPHTFKYDCSEKCQYCRYKRSDIKHNYKIQRNEKNHWLECECGVKEQIEEHAWRVSQETEYAIIYFCDFCKLDKRKSIPKATETPASTATIAPAEETPATGETGGNNMIIIISVVAAVVVLGGIGVGIAVKKKRGVIQVL